MKKKGEKNHILSSARALTARMGEKNRVRPPGQHRFPLVALPGVPACGPTRRAGQEGGDERRGAARNPNLLPEGRGGEEEKKSIIIIIKKSSTTQRATRFVRRTWDPPRTPMDPAEPPCCSQGCFWDRRRSLPAHSRAKTKPEARLRKSETTQAPKIPKKKPQAHENENPKGAFFTPNVQFAAPWDPHASPAKSRLGMCPPRCPASIPSPFFFHFGAFFSQGSPQSVASSPPRHVGTFSGVPSVAPQKGTGYGVAGTGGALQRTGGECTRREGRGNPRFIGLCKGRGSCTIGVLDGGPSPIVVMEGGSLPH